MCDTSQEDEEVEVEITYSLGDIVDVRCNGEWKMGKIVSSSNNGSWDVLLLGSAKPQTFSPADMKMCGED